MITRVSLTNWKSHLDSEISFSKGVNALIGIMGSGKTSIMQAIAFGLFGTFSALGSKKLGLDDLIMAKPQKKDSASVEIEFEAGGKKYAVKRTVERGKGTASAEIREGGKLVEVNPQGVTREVERALQMDSDLFQRAVYSEQNSLDYFLQIPKGKRMQQIDEMLKLDRYEKARESSVYVRNRVLDRRKEMLKVIEDMKGAKLDERMAELGKEIKELEKERDELGGSIVAVEKERKRLSEAVVRYEANHELLTESIKKAESLAARAAEMKRQAESRRLKLRGSRVSAEILKKMAGDILKLDARLDGKASEIRMLRDTVAAKNSRMLSMRDQLRDAKLKVSESRENEMRLKRLESLLGDDPEKRISALLEGADALKKRLYSITAEKNEVEKSLRELKDAGEKCPVCESGISGERKKSLIEHRMRRMGSFDIMIRETNERLAKANAAAEGFRKNAAEYAELRCGLKDLGSMRERIAEGGGKLSLLSKEIACIASEMRKKENEERKLRADMEGMKIRRVKAEALLREKDELHAMEEERASLAKHAKTVSRQTKALEKRLEGKDIKSMRSALQEAVGKSRGMETRLRDAEEMLRGKKKGLRETEEQAATLARYRKDSDRFGKAADSMDVFVSCMKETQDQLRDEFLKTVNSIMNGVWGELYPYGDFTEIRLLVDRDYTLQLKGTKGWMSADLLSGGERSLACLALRIAFSLAFTPNLRWLILDEPTHNLDANAIGHFGSVLRERMGNIIDQVFLITHEERLSDYITGASYRLERDKENDGVTRMVEM